MSSFLYELHFGGIYPPSWLQCPAPRRKRKKRRKRYKGKDAQITIGMRTRQVLMRRMAAAVGRGKASVIEDEGRDASSIAISDAEYALLLTILIPEEYYDPSGKPKPTNTPPGSAERVAVYAERQSSGKPIFCPEDASSVQEHVGVLVEQRGNGTGPRVLGWSWEWERFEEKGKPDEP